MNKFSERLKSLMEEKRYFQKDIARELGFCQQAISKWITGVNEPDFDTLIKICDFFDISTDYMLGVSDF